ncbi:MAG: hypothetical protein H7296_02620 [Bacteroidia bacterium]|nr:hypothetical protein [Bacteroidia bacterium]
MQKAKQTASLKNLNKNLVQGYVFKSGCLFLIYKKIINDVKPSFSDGCIETPCRKPKIVTFGNGKVFL